MSKQETLEFVQLARCSNPMQAEIFPAALREADIPHRAHWDKSGDLLIMVARDWHQEALEVLQKSAKVFFNESFSESEQDNRNNTLPAAEPRRGDPQDEEVEEDQGVGLFLSDALPSPEECKIKPIWPARLVAMVPGLGLGHLYAGKAQMFFYLFFCSLLGLLFFHLTNSKWYLLLILFSWIIDFSFSSHFVLEHNRKANRALRRLRAQEQEFEASGRESA